MLLDRGYEVHVIDNVERGRAGFAPGLWSGAPITRSLQEAWRLFRIGSDAGFATRSAFAGQRFPHETLEQLARTFVPRWLSTTGLQAAALAALCTGWAVLFWFAIHRARKSPLRRSPRAGRCVPCLPSNRLPVRKNRRFAGHSNRTRCGRLSQYRSDVGGAADRLASALRRSRRHRRTRGLPAVRRRTEGRALASAMHDLGHDMVLAAGLEALSHRL